MARTDEALEILQKADGPLTAKEVFERSNEFQGAAEACWAINTLMKSGKVIAVGKKPQDKGVCAYNAEEAVERWARWDDANSADYHIVGGQPAKVMARDLSTGTATEWIVSGESVPHYSARKIAAGGEG